MPVKQRHRYTATDMPLLLPAQNTVGSLWNYGRIQQHVAAYSVATTNVEHRSYCDITVLGPFSNDSR